MAVKFQYNKTSLQALEKNLKSRIRSLPTIKSKEAALRLEVKRAKADVEAIEEAAEKQIQEIRSLTALWEEFDQSLIKIKDVNLSVKKIAGVSTPVLDEVEFELEPFSMFSSPSWFLDGVEGVKKLVKMNIEEKVLNQKMQLLDYARKKTTQKVNLFEKVQIPAYEEAIRKIKRFMEDEENLSKSAQKIVKSKQQRMRKEEELAHDN